MNTNERFPTQQYRNIGFLCNLMKTGSKDVRYMRQLWRQKKSDI